MNHITISFQELLARVLEMKEDGVKVVHLQIDEGDPSGDDPLPPCLYLSAAPTDGSLIEVDYDEIEELSEP